MPVPEAAVSVLVLYCMQATPSPGDGATHVQVGSAPNPQI